VNRAQFASRYAAAFRSFLDDRTERSLRIAYELGREAVKLDLSLLDVAAAHHDVLADALARSGRDAADVATASGDFLIESLSAFEMVQRGVPEAQRAMASERRRSRMLRRLSDLLADESLALGEADSLEEILRLVAENARELTNARTCSVETTVKRLRGAIVAEASPDAATPDRSASALAGDVLRVPLLALDGSALGWIQVAESEHGRFTSVDEALLTQVAQMTAATIERVLAYE
jgi:hypothetical protein